MILKFTVLNIFLSTKKKNDYVRSARLHSTYDEKQMTSNVFIVTRLSTMKSLRKNTLEMPGVIGSIMTS